MFTQRAGGDHTGTEWKRDFGYARMMNFLLEEGLVLLLTNDGPQSLRFDWLMERKRDVRRESTDERLYVVSRAR